jgi:hypothetical protein
MSWRGGDTRLNFTVSTMTPPKQSLLYNHGIRNLRPKYCISTQTPKELNMTEPLSVSVLVTLATPEDFIKSGTGDLAKRFTAEAVTKIPVLWGKIRDRLTGKSVKVNESLAKLESGDSTAIETIKLSLKIWM